jgi:hypothetical protein
MSANGGNRGNRQAKFLHVLEVNDELKRHGLLHRQVRGLRALEDLVHIDGAAPPGVASRVPDRLHSSPLPTDNGVISPRATLAQALDASTSLQARICHGSSPLQIGPRHAEKPNNTWAPPQDMC